MINLIFNSIFPDTHGSSTLRQHECAFVNFDSEFVELRAEEEKKNHQKFFCSEKRFALFQMSEISEESMRSQGDDTT